MRKRGWVVAGAGLLALAAGLLAAAAGCYYPAYRSALAARDELREAQSILRERRFDASAAELEAVEARLGRAEDNFRQARDALDWVDDVGTMLPLIDRPLRATTQLTEIGLRGVHVGRHAVELARTFDALRAEEGAPLAERTDAIFASLDPAVHAIEDEIRAIERERSGLDSSGLPSPLRRAVRDVDDDLARLRELVATYEGLSAFLPEFLGFDGPRTYLVLAQNNAELMPTGGLISVHGVVTVERGRISGKHFEDAVAFGGRWLERSGDHVRPPAALANHLLRGHSWNFAVSNWSPDFPASAVEAERFFSLAGGPPVDGVLAINVHTIEELLRVTGPVAIHEYGLTVTPENALDVIEEHTRSGLEPLGDRKAFVGLLAEELLSRLAALPPDRWAELVDTLDHMRSERSLLFFSRDAGQQGRATQLGIDGALKSPLSDYLMLVDASVNSTKLNVALEQTLELSIRLDARGVAQHELRVGYHNDLPRWALGRDPALVQRLMLGGVYGGYTRVFAPYASRMEGVALDGREVGPEEAGQEHGKSVFGRYFALPAGASTTLVFEYSTPGIVRRDGDTLEYGLLVQRQPGTGPLPLELRMDLPAGARIISAALDGEELAAVERIATDLAEDRELVVRYRLED